MPVTLFYRFTPWLGLRPLRGFGMQSILAGGHAHLGLVERLRAAPLPFASGPFGDAPVAFMLFLAPSLNKPTVGVECVTKL